MDRVLIRQLAAELGLSSQTLDPLRRMPYEQATAYLDKLKAVAKKQFKKLAVKYHPDHNPDRVEWATKMFNALMQATKAVESLRIKRRRAMPIMHVMQPQVVQGSGGITQRVSFYAAAHPFASANTTTASTAGSAYDARRVVFIQVI